MVSHSPSIAQTTLIRFVVDLLYNKLCTCRGFVVDLSCMLWICCGFVVQRVVQQIHTKSYKWSLGYLCVTFVRSGINGERKSRGQPINRGSPGKMSIKMVCMRTRICVHIHHIHLSLTRQLMYNMRHVCDLVYQCKQSHIAS